MLLPERRPAHERRVGMFGRARPAAAVLSVGAELCDW